MKKKNNNLYQFYPIHLFYCIFSIAIFITYFFPYYEKGITGWGIPCNNWYSITGFYFIINNSLTITGIIGVVLEIISPFLFYKSKIKEALILVTLGNILIGINLFYLSNITKQISLPGLYDVYFLYHLKPAYLIAMFTWSITCGTNLTQIIIEIEKKIYCMLINGKRKFFKFDKVNFSKEEDRFHIIGKVILPYRSRCLLKRRKIKMSEKSKFLFNF